MTTTRTQVRLPRETEKMLREIAKLAGLSVESVIKIALATEVWRWKRDHSTLDDAEQAG